MSKSPKQEERAKKPRRKLTAAERKEIRKIMEKARGDGKPHSAQDTLPFRQIYPDGLCKLDDTTWSRCIEFEDVNYQLAQPDDQTAIFEALCDLYNSHDSSIGMEVSLPCRHMNQEDFVKRILHCLKRNPNRQKVLLLTKKRPTTSKVGRLSFSQFSNRKTQILLARFCFASCRQIAKKVCNYFETG